jgi:hypothetical protein
MKIKGQINYTSDRKLIIKAVQISDSIATPYLIVDITSPNTTTILESFTSPEGWPSNCIPATESNCRLDSLLSKYFVAIWLISEPITINAILNELIELVMIFNTNNVANMYLSKEILAMSRLKDCNRQHKITTCIATC